MNLQVIVAELKEERDRIDRAIAALDGITTNNRVRGTKGRATATRPASTRSSHRSRRGHLTAAGRKRLSELMKRRWAERRRKASSGRKSADRAA
jgi:hypothetical protein